MKDVLTPEERRLIDEAVAEGCVRVIPRGVSSETDKARHKWKHKKPTKSRILRGAQTASNARRKAHGTLPKEV